MFTTPGSREQRKQATASGSNTITANSTATSGFSAGKIPYSDGSLIQASTLSTSGTNLTITPAVNEIALTIPTVTHTSVTKSLSITQTQNSTSVHTGVLFINLLAGASAPGATSLLIDAQYASGSQFKADRQGITTVGAAGGLPIILDSTMPFVGIVNTNYGMGVANSELTFRANSATPFVAATTAGFKFGSTISLAWVSTGVANAGTADLFLRVNGAATLQQGAANTTSAVAQFTTVQSVTGASNTAGALWTYKDSAGTGTADSGGYAWQIAKAAGSSSTTNTWATVLALDKQGLAVSDFINSIGGWKRVSTQFDKTSDTTLANVTGLSVSVLAGKTYQFAAILFYSSNVGGGVQAAIAGTATATTVIYDGDVVAGNQFLGDARATSLGTAVAQQTVTTSGRIEIKGIITVNAAGTLTVQFAQNASNGSASSVLVGSYFLVVQLT